MVEWEVAWLTLVELLRLVDGSDVDFKAALLDEAFAVTCRKWTDMSLSRR